MTNKSFLRKFLNVRTSEWKIVKQLFWLQFFMGTGIAFFFTSSFSHFLEKFSATELAWVMIISAPLLFVTGWIFNKFEHHFQLTKVGTAVIILMSLSIVVFQVSGQLIKDDWFDYLFFAWYYVLYLASNLCFWSITSTLFDVRQSKRLFALISGGDIPAKFIGYTMAYFFVKAIGPLNMLWPAFIFTLCALPFLFQIAKSGVIHHHHDTHEHHHVEVESGNMLSRKMSAIIKRFTLNALIRRLAVLTFLISSALAIVNYSFYTEIKEDRHDDKDLSNFIILFMAGSQIVALLVKIIFTGRIVNSIGIKKALMITPIILLSILLVIIPAEYQFSGADIIFYAFGMAAIAVEVLRNAITNPVFLTVMQPLNHHERTKAHAIVKGIMDPFAFLVSGLVLVLITHLHVKNELLIICYILAFLAIFWIVLIYMVNNTYTQTLLKTISSRFFSQDEFRLSDEEVQEQVVKKIETGNESEVIYILQMLNTQLSDDSKHMIFKLLDHPSDQVKKSTLQLIQSRNISGAEEKIKSLADNAESKEVRLAAVESLCKKQNSHHHQKHFIHSHDPEVRTAALTGMLESNQKESHTEAVTIINELIWSKDETEKLLAIQVLTNVKDHYCHPHLISLLQEDDETLPLILRAIGRSADKPLLEKAMSFLNDSPVAVLDAMHNAGSTAIPVIVTRIKTSNDNFYIKEKLIATLGKINDHNAQNALITLLDEHAVYSGPVIKALYRGHYKAGPETQKKMEEKVLSFIAYGTEILYMQQFFVKEKEKYSILINSLSIELNDLRNTMIYLFGCIYDHQKAFRIRQGLDMNKKDSTANALELIEVTVRKDIAALFNKLFETVDIDHRTSSLKHLLPGIHFQHTKDIMNRILKEEPIPYSTWTKACSMYVAKKENIELQPEILQKFLYSDNKLLRETALYYV